MLYTFTFNLGDTKPHQLAALIRGANPTAPTQARTLTLQADAANSGTVAFGDGTLSATNCGGRLAAGAFAPTLDGPLDAAGIYVQASAAGQAVNVALVVA